MASALSYLFNFILPFLFYVVLFSTNKEAPGWYSETKSLENDQSNITNLHFYLHDIFTGKQLVVGTNDSVDVVIIDTASTKGPDPTSKLIGRAYGSYMRLPEYKQELIIAFRCTFVEGKYNGSTLNFCGKSLILDPVRELYVVGGTGLFESISYGYAKLILLGKIQLLSMMWPYYIHDTLFDVSSRISV